MTRRRIAAIVVLALSAIALVAGWTWYQQRKVKRAENELALSTARTLSEAFSRSSALKVAQLNGEVAARVETSSAGGLLSPTLRIRAPYSVQYFVNLRAIDRSAYRWNAESQTMFVALPDVVAEQPGIDFARATMDFDGVFVSRTAAARLQQEGGKRMVISAAATARRADNLEKARVAARRAVSDLLGAPLQAAGHGNVTVVVRFTNEEPAGDDRERWDTTRSIAEVMADLER